MARAGKHDHLWGFRHICFFPACTHAHTPQSKPTAAVTGTEDQEKLLTEALNMVKKSSFEMKTCLVGSPSHSLPSLSLLSNVHES